MKDNRLEKLAEILVCYSTDVKVGDDVCLSGEDAALPFLKAVAKEVVKRGGILRYFVDIPEIDKEILDSGSNEQIEQPDFNFSECAKSDVWISAWGTKNTKIFQSVSSEKLKMRRLANKENRKIYTTRSADGSLRWCGTQFPTEGDAQNAGMSLDEYEDFVYRAGFLYEEDPVSKWIEMEKNQEKWISYLNTKNELHILSKNTDLTVNISGRKWISCCGRENFPDGEIFTSPVNYGTNGKIMFSYPSIINGHEFFEVTLKVIDGKIVEAFCTEEEKNSDLISYLDTDEGSRFFGEVAIGTNYGIDKYTKNILFDEKIGGSMHLAIGESFPEAGGINTSAIHWDMITDMVGVGEIYADGELFYKEGQFVESVL